MNDSRQQSSNNHQSSSKPVTSKPAPKRQRLNQHSGNTEMPSLNRQDSDISLYAQPTTVPDTLEIDGNSTSTLTPWTRKQWEALERWYVKQNRDCQQATKAFFIHESVTSESNTPLWSKGYISWRCQCLDTNTKYHDGLLPSERQRIKDKLKQLSRRHQHSRPKHGIQQQQQQPKRQHHERYRQ